MARCGHCNVDTSSEHDIRHCSQCHGVYHEKCVLGDGGLAAPVSALSGACDEWVCMQCFPENAVDDDAAIKANQQSAMSRTAAWMPPPDGVVPWLSVDAAASCKSIASV